MFRLLFNVNSFDLQFGGHKMRDLFKRSYQTWAALILTVLFSQTLWAAAPKEESPSTEPGILSVQFENDGLTQDLDGYYTQGSRFSYLSNQEPSRWLISSARLLPFFTLEGKLRTSYALGQSIFTPDDIKRSELIVDDRPYAGWLYGAIGLIAEYRDDSGVFKNRRDSLELNIGIVGPAAYGEQTQTFGHKVRGATEPEGWDNQLDDEPGFMLLYDRQWQGRYNLALNGLGIDLIPHVGAALGNVMTYAAAGATIRFGDHLKEDFGVPLIRPSQPGSVYFAKTSWLSWYLFVGIEGRAILQNIFLDGNTFTDSHSVDKKDLVGDIQTGLVLTWGDYRLSFTNVFRGKEFDGQPNSTQYGSISLSLRL